MWRRHNLCALALASTLACFLGCSKGDNSSQGEARPDAGGPVQMSLPGGSQADLTPENIQAEIDKAGAGIHLARIDLSSVGLPLLMEAPEGAKVQKDRFDIQVTAGDHFAIRIGAGKRRLERKRQQMAGQKLLINQKDLVVAESALLLEARCEFGKHLIVGHRDYCVENIDPIFGKQVNHSQADCLLMLRCVATLAPSKPLPEDPAAALPQLGANLTKGKSGAISGVRLDEGRATDATLALLAKVSTLEQLDLHHCSITDEGLAHLAGLTNLRELNLSDCEFTDAGLSLLSGLVNLESLNLASSFGDSPQIKGPGLAALSGMKKLRVLILDKNLVDDAALEHLKNLQGLHELYLEQTRVVGPGLVHLKGLAALTLLSLSETKVTDAGLSGLQGVSSLEVLNLHGTFVSGEGIKHLQGLKNLHTLNLGNTTVADAALANLRGLSGLKHLILEGTEVSDSGLEPLQSLKGLKQVALVRTKVTKFGADKLKAALPGVEVTIDQ
jgi:hypothetical protein